MAGRAAVPAPSGVKGLPAGGQVDAGEVPSLQQLGFGPEAQAQARQGPLGAEQLRGGESQALQHVQVRGRAGGWPGPGRAGHCCCCGGVGHLHVSGWMWLCVCWNRHALVCCV